MSFGQWLRWRVEEQAGSASGHPMNIMCRVDGSSDLSEEVLPHREGYRRSFPVRIGNGAADQLQLDIYGEALDSVYYLHRHGQEVSYQGWQAACDVLEWLVDHWDQAEEGIWGDARRTEALHLRAGDVLGGLRPRDQAGDFVRQPANLSRWLQERDAVYEQVLSRRRRSRRRPHQPPRRSALRAECPGVVYA